MAPDLKHVVEANDLPYWHASHHADRVGTGLHFIHLGKVHTAKKRHACICAAKMLQAALRRSLLLQIRRLHDLAPLYKVVAYKRFKFLRSHQPWFIPHHFN